MGGKTIYDTLQKQVLDKYEIESELKNSKRSKVLLLRSRNTGQRRIFRQFAGTGEAYKAMLDLSCSHLPKIEAVAEAGGQVLVLEEHIQGDTLAFLLENGPLPPEQARSIAVQICRALAALHALGIVHRDVKPENILLRGNEAVLIDFDASRVYKTEGRSDTRIMGTTGYAAPEQYGFSQTDARADIYSLGILLNEMLTLQHPATCLADGPLRPLIEKCIEVNVDKRYHSVSELLIALEAAQPREKARLWRFILPAMAVLVGVAAALLWPKTAQQAPPAAGSSVQPSTPQLLDIPIMEWTGPANTANTAFTYDLDGDGKEEDYVFGLATDIENSNIGLSGHDGRSPIPGMPSQLIIAPGVGTFVSAQSTDPVPEFGSLLENITLTLYCAEQQGTSVPEVWHIDDLNGIWPSTVCILLEAEDAGVWLYEYTAELNGETLVARGVSTVQAGSASGEAS